MVVRATPRGDRAAPLIEWGVELKGVEPIEGDRLAPFVWRCWQRYRFFAAFFLAPLAAFFAIVIPPFTWWS